MNCEHYLVNNTNLEAYGLSITGQVRKANEDSCGFATVPNGELFVVCDGMGGHVGGATASRIAVEQIIQHFQAQLYPNIYEALNDALCRANIQILGEAAANPSLKGMGTTACIVLVNGNDAYIAHVGDSRIYLFEAQKKRLFRITKDHSFVQSLVDMGQLDDREAEHHPRKNVIMKALGTKEELKPEVYPSPVQPAKGDMFLICSDGLSGMVDDNGIEAILASNQSVEQKVVDLVTNANAPGKGLDNITAQVIKVLESPYPVSNHPDHNPRWRNEPNGGATRDVEKSMGPQFPPQAVRPPQKKMNAKLLALIIVGGLLLLGTVGAIAVLLFMDRDTNEEKTLKEEIEGLVSDSIKYQTMNADRSTKLREDEFNRICEELKEKKDRLESIQKKGNNGSKGNNKGNNGSKGKNRTSSNSTSQIDESLGSKVPKNSDVQSSGFTLSTGEEYTYEGEKDKKGIPNGKGEAVFSDRKYVGQFKDGNLEGEGVLTFTSGEKEGRAYTGKFSNNRILGRCTVSSGDTEFYGLLNESMDYDYGILVNQKTKDTIIIQRDVKETNK